MSSSGAAVRRFLRILLRVGAAERRDGRVCVASSRGAAQLSASEAARLVQQDVLRFEGDKCLPTALTRSFLEKGSPSEATSTAAMRDVVRDGAGTLRRLAADPVARLAQSAGGGFLAAHHLAAGERVSRWGQRAQLRQRVTMSYDPAQVGGRRHGREAGDVGDMAIEARRSLARLYADLPRECADTIVDVCVFEKGLQTIETERGWPRRSAKLVLRIGLDQLAQRLGLMPEAVGKPTGRVRAEMDESFRPDRFE